jgi:RNA polymerase sigma-70 factor (ECF subfamily)
MVSSATLPNAVLRWDADPPAAREGETLDQAQELERFLSSVEKRAFRIARIAVRHDDDALDIVQDSMLQLARRYGERPCEEWRPLFYRILQNRIRDCQRRRKVRARVLAWLPGWRDDEGEAGDPYESVPASDPAPGERAMTEQALELLERALRGLPARQQEAFMLRNFEGMDVAETAAAMGCTAGSVKTHYSRAVHTLREQLGEAW